MTFNGGLIPFTFEGMKLLQHFYDLSLTEIGIHFYLDRK